MTPLTFRVWAKSGLPDDLIRRAVSRQLITLAKAPVSLPNFPIAGLLSTKGSDESEIELGLIERQADQHLATL